MKQHPDTEQLLDYCLAPTDAHFSELATHLASCAECRNRAAQLSALPQQIKRQASLAITSTHIADDSSSEALAAYLDGRLDSASAQRVKQQIHGQADALKAALHYATHSAAMRRELADTAPVTSTQSTASTQTTIDVTAVSPDAKIPHAQTPGLGQMIKATLSRWLDWSPHAWISVPVTAVAVFSVTLLLLPQLNMQHKSSTSPLPISANVIAVYQDDPFISFHAANAQRPGIGFFNTTPAQRESFKPVTLSINNSGLDMRWPRVKNAQDYQIQLAVYHGTVNHSSEAETLFSQNTSQAAIHFDNFTPEPGRRYEWTISGHTTDNQTFKASGGFVLN